jgi:hypothetical protein
MAIRLARIVLTPLPGAVNPRGSIMSKTSQGIRWALSAAATFVARLAVGARGGGSDGDEVPRTGSNPAGSAPVAAESGSVSVEAGGVAAMLKWANSLPANESDGQFQATGFGPPLDNGRRSPEDDSSVSGRTRRRTGGRQ